jgi:hypothetical protein
MNLTRKKIKIHYQRKNEVYRRVRKLIFSMQPYFDPTSTSQKTTKNDCNKNEKREDDLKKN